MYSSSILLQAYLKLFFKQGQAYPNLIKMDQKSIRNFFLYKLPWRILYNASVRKASLATHSLEKLLYSNSDQQITFLDKGERFAIKDAVVRHKSTSNGSHLTYMVHNNMAYLVIIILPVKTWGKEKQNNRKSR